MNTLRALMKSWVAKLRRFIGNAATLDRAAKAATQAMFCLATIMYAQAQPSQPMPRIAVIFSASPAASQPSVNALEQGLLALGYAQGKNIALEYQYAVTGEPNVLTDIANEVGRRKVDVIVTPSTIAARALMRASPGTPVVMAGTGDPVGAGLVTSLSHPGGNVTGLSSIGPELNVKRLEVLKQLEPSISKVVVFFNGANPSNVASLKDVERAGQGMRVEILAVDVRTSQDIAPAVDTAARRGNRALLIERDPLFAANVARIVAGVSDAKLLAIFPDVEYTRAGGLISYGASTPDLFRRSATYIDKILRGSKPAQLPVEQPSRFQLAVNLKTARALGVTIPQPLLLRADEVIE